MIEFKLPESFIDEYRGKQPEWGPLGYITYKRTYARRLEGRTEEFFETVQRVVEGSYSIQKEHCYNLGLPWIEEKAIRSASKMYEKIWNFKFSPAGRGLWIMGTPFVKKHGSMALNSCGFVSTEDINIKGVTPFLWCMDSLMLGVGVGFDTKGDGKIIIKKPHKTNAIYTIPDTREGWVSALGKVMNGFFKGEPIPEFNYSLIRPEGKPIRGFGGVASGPKALKTMLNYITTLLKKKTGKMLSTSDIVDIFNVIGKCVVAGNVRRSALISLGDIEDKSFIALKQDKKNLIHHRWASNNSVLAFVGTDYTPIIENIKKNGEPGIIWLENARDYSRMCEPPDYKDSKAAGVNPCSEQTLESYGLCCLVETFPSRHDSYKEFQETLKYAYLYAKSVTLLNTHWGVTNAVMGKNRRIGTSQSGIIDAFNKHGRKTMIDWCKKGYEYLQKKDKQYSDWLCIPKSIKITSVKPSGTVSLLPGVSPGIHYPHSEYYIRRIRIAKNSELIPFIRRAGYKIEDDLYSTKSIVVEFPIFEEFFKRSKEDVSIWEQFENAATYQKYWADNQVSITITFKPEEIKDIKCCLECYEDKLKGVSLLPLLGHGYKQAPYEKITKEEYEKMIKKIKPIRLNSIMKEGVGVEGCSKDTCIIKHEVSKIKPKLNIKLLKDDKNEM